MALRSIRVVRKIFDIVTSYNEVQMNSKLWVNRCIFLECLAGVPGMVGGMCKHLHSLRTMTYDHGLIHHLLEEAENERTHLFIFLEMKHPGSLFKGLIALSQAVFFNLYFLSYLLSPRFCHKFVGYLEE